MSDVTPLIRSLSNNISIITCLVVMKLSKTTSYPWLSWTLNTFIWLILRNQFIFEFKFLFLKLKFILKF